MDTVSLNLSNMDQTKSMSISNLDMSLQENASSINKTLEDYFIIEQVGKGEQGSVFKAKRKDDGVLIALKVLRIFPDSLEYENAIREIEILKIISNPECNTFLSCYYNHYYDEENKMLLVEMQYIEGVNLDIYCQRLFDQGLYDKLYRHLLIIIKDITLGLERVHNRDVLHNDIKPQNIIIDKIMTPKLVDFGLSCLTYKTEEPCYIDDSFIACCRGTDGTLIFSPPEMYIDRVRYKVSDVWSLGVTIYYVATGGYYPFPMANTKESLKNIIIKSEPKKLQTYNDLLDELVNGMLIKDPRNRITVNEIIDRLDKYN
jgi:serine/threonine protein kinase